MEETISLYLEIKEGEKPDFEVVGLTAAAFAEAVKEIAYILDPGMDVRLEFDSTTKASLSLNAVFKTLRTRDGQIGTLVGVIAGTSIAFIGDARQWTVGKVLDKMVATETRQSLTEDDIKRIEQACNRVSDGKIAKEPIRKVYKQLGRDPVIQSVGVTNKPDIKPVSPVPQSDFPKRAGVVQPVQTSPKDRTAPSIERLTLVSPVLLAATNRVWHFLSPHGEFSYYVKDDVFVDSIVSGQARLTLKAGIQITAKIDTFEVFEGGVWVPKRRSITKVVRIHRKRGQKQSDLFEQPKKRKPSKKKKSKTQKPKR